MALIDNLVSWWSLGEASGSALDSHGTNALADNNTVGTATGKIGNARDFEFANSEYLSCASNASLRTGDVDFAGGAWVQLESNTGANQAILAKRGGAGAREYLLLYNTGSNRFVFNVSNDGTAQTSVVANAFGALSTGVWYYVLFWHDAANNEIGIAVNGVENTSSYSSGVYLGTADFRLGSSQGDGFYFDGLLDEAFLVKSVPTSTQRSQLYNGGNGQPYARLLAPAVASWTVSADGLTIVGALDGMGFAAQSQTYPADFTLDGHSVDDWTVSGTTLTLSVSPAILQGETVSLDYAPPPDNLVDTEGHALPGFTGATVTNGSLVQQLDLPALPAEAIFGPSFADGLALPALPAGEIFGPAFEERLALPALAAGPIFGPALTESLELPALPAGAVFGPTLTERLALPALPAEPIPGPAFAEELILPAVPAGEIFGPAIVERLELPAVPAGPIYGPTLTERLDLPALPAGAIFGPEIGEELIDWLVLPALPAGAIFGPSFAERLSLPALPAEPVPGPAIAEELSLPAVPAGPIFGPSLTERVGLPAVPAGPIFGPGFAERLSLPTLPAGPIPGLVLAERLSLPALAAGPIFGPAFDGGETSARRRRVNNLLARRSLA